MTEPRKSPITDPRVRWEQDVPQSEWLALHDELDPKSALLQDAIQHRVTSQITSWAAMPHPYWYVNDPPRKDNQENTTWCVPLGVTQSGSIVHIDISSHCLLVGRTGSGKTNGLRVLIHGAARAGVSTTVFERKAELDSIDAQALADPPVNATVLRPEQWRIALLQPGRTQTKERFISAFADHVGHGHWQLEASRRLLKEAMHQAFAAAHPRNPTLAEVIDVLANMKIPRHHYRREGYREAALTALGELRNSFSASNAIGYRSSNFFEQLGTPGLRVMDCSQLTEHETVLIASLLTNSYFQCDPPSHPRMVVMEDSQSSMEAPGILEHAFLLGRSRGLAMTVIGQVFESAYKSSVTANTPVQLFFGGFRGEEKSRVARHLNLSAEQEASLPQLGVGDCIVRTEQYPLPILVKVPFV